MIDRNIQDRLRNKYNPEGSDLRNIQLKMLDILLEFDRICKKHNLTYWLDSGTLIGAIRHEGFIPWDDDVDVCILKKDYPKLKRIMQQELKENYSFYDIDTNDHYARRFPKIVDENVQITTQIISMNKDEGIIDLPEKLWIDVFLLMEGSPKTAKFVHEVYGRCYRRKFNHIHDGKIKHLIAVSLFPLARLMILILSITGKIFHHGSYIHNFGSTFFSVRKKKEIFPLSTVTFEGHEFPAPGNSDGYLKRIYGDYLSLPDESTIKTHNIVSIEYDVKTRIFK